MKINLVQSANRPTIVPIVTLSFKGNTDFVNTKQNPYSEIFGYKGFVCFIIDSTDYFSCFYLSIVSLMIIAS
ncbi:MAG TPA: hypothetical protein DDW65_02020 [Firmicutes bacterium]|nr:hypothetical protein [Bacillota bacterium]